MTNIYTPVNESILSDNTTPNMLISTIYFKRAFRDMNSNIKTTKRMMSMMQNINAFVVRRGKYMFSFILLFAVCVLLLLILPLLFKISFQLYVILKYKSVIVFIKITLFELLQVCGV